MLDVDQRVSQLPSGPGALPTDAAPSDAPAAPRSRRAVIAGAIGGAVGLLAGRLTGPGPVAAAAGDPIILGSQTNNAGNGLTQVLSSSGDTSFRIVNSVGTALMGHVQATSGSGRGVYGRTDTPNGDGVQARNAGAAGSGAAVRAFGGNNNGVVATTDGVAKNAVFGDATAVAASDSSNVTARGVSGSADGDGALVFFIGVPSAGVYGVNSYAGAGGSIAAGVWGDATGSNNTSAVRGLHYGSGAGVLASSVSGLAGDFFGDVSIDGDLAVSGTVSKGGGSFRIDHPLDPANKYLVHSFVESPEMLNVYSGNATTDVRGRATVTLPAWFSSVNKDLRYQLTTVGQQAQAWVSSEVKGGAFSIATDKPNVKVSWQLSGVRADAWADANRIQVEMDKPAAERGKYLHPALYGQSAENGVRFDRVTASAKAAVAKHGAAKTREMLRANARS